MSRSTLDNDSFYANIRNLVVSFLIFLSCSIVAYYYVQHYRWRPTDKAIHTHETGSRRARMAVLLDDGETGDEQMEQRRLVGRRGGPIRELKHILEAGKRTSMKQPVMNDGWLDDGEEDGLVRSTSVERRTERMIPYRLERRPTLLRWMNDPRHKRTSYRGLHRRSLTNRRYKDFSRRRMLRQQLNLMLGEKSTTKQTFDDDLEDDTLEHLLPRLMCVVALAAALLNLLWLPVTAMAKGLTEWTQQHDYWRWLTFSLLYTVHCHAIYAANIAIYALLPLTFFYSEAAHSVGMPDGARASLREAVIQWMLVATLAAGGLYVVVSFLGARGLDGWLAVMDGWMAVVSAFATVYAVPKGSMRVFQWICKLPMRFWHQKAIRDQLLSIEFEEATWKHRLERARRAIAAKEAVSMRRTVSESASRPRRNETFIDQHGVLQTVPFLTLEDLDKLPNTKPLLTDEAYRAQDLEEERAWEALLEQRRTRRQRQRSASDTDLTQHQRMQATQGTFRLSLPESLTSSLVANVSSEWLSFWSRSTVAHTNGGSDGEEKTSAASSTFKHTSHLHPPLSATTFRPPAPQLRRPRSASEIEHGSVETAVKRLGLSWLNLDWPSRFSTTTSAMVKKKAKDFLARSTTFPRMESHSEPVLVHPVATWPELKVTPSSPTKPVSSAPLATGTRLEHDLASDKSEVLIAQQYLARLAEKRRAAEQVLGVSPLWRNVLFVTLLAGYGISWLLLVLRIILSLVRGLVELAVPVTNTALESILLLRWIPSSSASVFLRIVLVVYFCICTLVGVYDSPAMRRVRPRPGQTTTKVLVLNIALLVILAAGLPVLAAVLGLSDTTSLADAAHDVVASAQAMAAPEPVPDTSTTTSLLSFLQQCAYYLSPMHLVRFVVAIWQWLRDTLIWLVYPSVLNADEPLVSAQLVPAAPPAPPVTFSSSPVKFIYSYIKPFLPFSLNEDSEIDFLWFLSLSEPRAADAWTHGGRAVAAGLPDFGSWGIWLATAYRAVMFVAVSYSVLERTVLSSLRAG
jgi:hypothetical protein